MSELLQRVEKTIYDRLLLQRGQGVLVAVSGGLDSMALLQILNRLAPRLRWRLVVAHFNHQLRGRASDADEKLVRKSAATLGLSLIMGSADVKAFATKSKLSLETAARKLRHEFLARAARGRKIKTIALAHQADDQMELFFLRLLRGAGGEGLAGMKWRSPSPADPQLALVRPLLGFSKAELETFARQNNIRFRHDATNFSSDFLRNRVRNELLPLLRNKYQPALDQTVRRLMEIVGAESEFLGEAARQWLRGSERESAPTKNRGRLTRAAAIDRTPFEKLPVAVQRRVLRLRLAELGIPAGFDLVESLRRAPEVFVSTGPNRFVGRDPGGKIKLRPASDSAFNRNELPVSLSDAAGEADFAGIEFRWQTGAQKRIHGRFRPAATKSNRELFDAGKVGGEIVLRHWRPGDRFQPIGLPAPAKLQDLFTNAKIPRTRRRELVLATTAHGNIFWVEGLRIGERFKWTPKTARTLAWQWSNLAV